MSTLIIDTTNNKEVIICLKIDNKKIVKKKNLETGKSQQVLPLIVKLLSENKLSLKDIGALEVNTGPGSFTGIRVGIAIANTLSFFLKIPVNGKKIGDFAQASYT